MRARLANRMQFVKPSAIRELLRLGADPSIISFGGGYPDASLFPLDKLAETFEAVISQNGREALQYTVSNGAPHLRAQVAARMSRDGVPSSAENILILQGGQQGLDLAAKLTIDKGDVIVTEDPTFLGALIAFNPCEPRYAAIPIDDDGMDMEALESVLKRTPGARLIYTVPDFQNPTGVTMSLARRKRLVELANEFNLIVLEDSPYREIRFEGEQIPPIKSFDTEERVIYLGSFSKILAPGLRLGWAVASPEIVERLGLLKLAADTQCSTLNMAAVSLFLDRYDIEAHIASIRDVYRRKKDVMLGAIRRNLPQVVAFTEPKGGMFTWLTFPDGFDAGEFMRERAVPDGKVAYVPGATFYPTLQQANHARLSYATQSDDNIVRGITGLGGLLTKSLRA